MSPQYTASTILNYSARKTRLVIDQIRGQVLDQAMLILQGSNKGKTKKIYNLLKSAAANLKLTQAEFTTYKVSSIVAEEAQKLYRVVPRARGSSSRIRRRYSRIKVLLESLNKPV